MDDVKYVDSADGQRLAPGDILFNNTNSPELVGKTAYIGIERDLAFSNHMTRLRTASGVDARYVAIYLHFLWASRYLQHRCTNHVNQASIAGSTLSNTVPLFLPPTAEQRRIVTALDEHLSGLDAAVAGLKRARANIVRWQAATFFAAARGAECGATISSTQAPQSNDAGSWLLPSTWRWVTVADAGDVLLGRQRAPQFLTGRHSRPYLRVANVGDDSLDLTDLKEMDFNRAHLEKYALLPGDILVSEGQSPELVGQSAIYRGGIEHLCFQKTLHRFRANPERVVPEFAQIVFRAYVKSGVFQRHASLTVNIAHLTLERFKAVPFPLPPLEEQHSLVEKVHARLAVAERTAAEIDVQLARAKRLRQSILKRAFEGKLVPQDPVDEPASALIDRIRAQRATAPARAGAARRARAASR